MARLRICLWRSGRVFAEVCMHGVCVQGRVVCVDTKADRPNNDRHVQSNRYSQVWQPQCPVTLSLGGTTSGVLYVRLTSS